MSPAKARRGEEPHADERIRLPELVVDEGPEQEHARQDRPDGRHARPPPRAGLLQAEHQEAHGGGDESGAAEVDGGRLPVLSGLRAGDEDQRDQSDRDVDPEDRAPGPLGQEAAGERPDRGQRTGDAEERRQRAPPLLDGEGADDDRQRRREQQRREAALDDAPADHPHLAEAAGRCRAAQRGSSGKADHAGDDHPTMPEHVRELAAEHEEGGQGEQVAVDDPLRAGRRQREVLLQVGDGEADDRLVDEHHRHREDHRHEHEPRARPRGGGRGGHGAP